MWTATISVLSVVGKHENFEDENRMGYREEFSDNVYIPLNTLWQRIYDFYSRGAGGSVFSAKLQFESSPPKSVVSSRGYSTNCKRRPRWNGGF